MKKDPLQTPEATEIRAFVSPQVEAHNDQGIAAASLEGLPKVVQKLVASTLPSYHDKWQLARSSRRFYHLLNKDLLKAKVYSFGMVPLGLLDNAVFSRFQPNFHELIHFFRRRRDLRSIIRLDDELIWPLLALMPEMEEALKEAVADDPKQVDLVGCDVLDYLAVRGNEKLFRWWIENYYPGFTKEDKPDLLRLAIMGKNKAIIRLLIDVYQYPLDWTEENLDEPFSPVRVICAYGDIDLFTEHWNIITSEKGKTPLAYDLCPAIEAAKVGNWALCDALIAKDFVNYRTEYPHLSAQQIATLSEYSAERKAELLCYAARDDHERFLRWLLLCTETDLRLFTIDLRRILSFACEGGNIQTVDHIIQQVWYIQDYMCFGIYQGISFCGYHAAAKYVHLALIENFRKKYNVDVAPFKDGMSEGISIAHFAAMSGDWEWYLILVNTYFPHDWLPYHDPLGGPVTPLGWAVREGHLYFAQQYILKYGTDYLRGCETDLLNDAENSGNPVLKRWLQKQITNLRPQERIVAIQGEDASSLDSSFNFK